MKFLLFFCCLMAPLASFGLLPIKGVYVLGDVERDTQQFPLEMLRWAQALQEHYLRFQQLEESLRRTGDPQILFAYLPWLSIHSENFRHLKKVPPPVLLEILEKDWDRLNQVNYQLSEAISPELKNNWRVLNSTEFGWDIRGNAISLLSAMPRVGGFDFQERIEPWFYDFRGRSVERNLESYEEFIEQQDLFKVFTGALEEFGDVLYSEILNHEGIVHGLSQSFPTMAEMEVARLSMEAANHRMRSTSERLQASYFQFMARQKAQEIEEKKRDVARDEIERRMDRDLEAERRQRLDESSGNEFYGYPVQRLRIP